MVLHEFIVGSEGGSPSASLLLGSDGALYGTTYRGGSTDEFGTVYKLATDGTGFSVLHAFGVDDGAYPIAGLIQGVDGALYGTTTGYGPLGAGTVYKLDIDGSDFMVLHGFNGADGASPWGGLLQDSTGMLYGTAVRGGTYDYGTVFKLAPDGTGFEELYAFDGSNDGGIPYAGLLLGSDGALYGTTGQSGPSGVGTVYKLATDGTGFEVLHVFDGSNGAAPYAGLIQDGGGALYGTTSMGGEFTVGTIYRLVDNGTDTTPPIITPHLTGPLGQNGWYVGTVKLRWSVLDDESAITSETGCRSVMVTRDTTGRTFTCTATSGGGMSQQQVTIKRDTDKPKVRIASPANEARYARHQRVTADFSCYDGGSGIQSCLGPVADGDAIPTNRKVDKALFTVTAIDEAGNRTRQTVSYSVR
jgi:uncharacterized repeat protein (TIGR03803 family)